MSYAKIIINGKEATIGGYDFTTDKSLAMTDENVLGVSNPVNGILSQEDYDALHPEEKEKGSYLIPLQEETFLPPSKNIYSEEEVLIGSWFGNPLYRRVIKHKTPSAINSWQTVITGLDNWDYMQISNCSIVSSNNVAVCFALLQYMLSNNGTEIQMYLKDAHIDEDIYTIFEYTKTIGG